MIATDAQLYTAGIVPFKPDGSVDSTALDTFHRRLNELGVDGIFAAGTTAEFATLDDYERLVVIQSALEVFGTTRVIAHTGHASLRQALRLTKAALKLGATRFAAMTPYFNPAEHEALIRYYAELHELIGETGELYGYHFPARSATIMSPEEHADIVLRAGLVGTKVSGLSAQETLSYLYGTPEGFRLFTGSDATFASVVHGGGYGAISGISSAYTLQFTAMRDALRRGDNEAEEHAQRDIDEAVASVEGANFALVKHALALQGLDVGSVRVALDAPSDTQLKRVAETVKRFQMLK